MTVYVLLKGRSVKGLVNFHGVTSSEAAANTWQAAGKNNWFWGCDRNDAGDYDNVQFEPIINEV